MAAHIIQHGNAGTPPRSGRFHHQVGNAKLLTPVQERSLAERIERGDFDAKTRMIEANLRLVAVIANRYIGLGLPAEDIFQEGVIGLIRAAEKYDYRKGYKFSTYASLWIREAMQQGLQKRGRIVCLPADVWRDASKIRRARKALSEQLGREPNSEEIAAELEMADEQVKAVILAFCDAVSLNAPTTGDDIELGDTLLDEKSPAPDRESETAAVKEAVRRGLDALEAKQREVIELRFGVGASSRTYTVTQAAEQLRIPRGELRRIEREATGRLQQDRSLAAWTTHGTGPATLDVRRAA
jgi:RNA polymerase primary sigma factor